MTTAAERRAEQRRAAVRQECGEDWDHAMAEFPDDKVLAECMAVYIHFGSSAKAAKPADQLGYPRHVLSRQIYKGKSIRADRRRQAAGTSDPPNLCVLCWKVELPLLTNVCPACVARLNTPPERTP